MDGLRKLRSLSCRITSNVASLTFGRHILDGTLKLCKFHGQSRLTDPVEFLDYDIVLITYATVASEFSKGNSVLHSVNWFRIVLNEGTYSCLD